VIIGLFPVASSLVLRFDDHIPRVPAGYRARCPSVRLTIVEPFVILIHSLTRSQISRR
jgi:hypothetical protein